MRFKGCRHHVDGYNRTCGLCGWFAYKRNHCPTHHPTSDAECTSCKHAASRRAGVALLAAHRRNPYLVHGVDLRDELKRFLSLPCIAEWGYRSKPTFHVRWAKHGGGGRAFILSNRMLVSVSPETTLARALKVTLHELIHLTLPASEGHSERFTLRMIRAIREAWGIVIPDWRDTPKGPHRVHTYAIEMRYQKILEERFARGEQLPAKAADPEPEPVADLTARRGELIRKRAEKAARLLERAERRQKAAAKLVQKWRAKVRYYERTIAANGRK